MWGWFGLAVASRSAGYGPLRPTLLRRPIASDLLFAYHEQLHDRGGRVKRVGEDRSIGERQSRTQLTADLGEQERAS